MRKALFDLISSSIVFKYELPNHTLGIDRSLFSTDNDKCFSSLSDDSLAEIIYNSIIDYSFNEFDINGKDYQSLHTVALKTKLRYNENATQPSKISYGFYGEVILFSLLFVKFRAKPLISRGYFYNPLESSETKGYDSYHLVQNNGTTELWFGEVKFRNTHSSSIRSALENVSKAISDNYLSNNFLALINVRNSFNISGTKIDDILNSWEKNPQIQIINEIRRYDMKLIYPIVILYNKSTRGYDKSILNAINYIKDNYPPKTFNLSIPYTIYFVWLPVDEVRNIKTTVIRWIESKKRLML